MVSMLDRKLLRDLARLRGQGLTIALVVACGVAAFVASFATHDSLLASRGAYYESAHFADLFARLKRAPNAVAERLTEIPGVAEAETRVVLDATLDLAGVEFPLVGRIIGLPASAQPAINRLYLRRGRMPDPASLDEAVVNEAFALANRLAPGDSVAAVMNGRRQTLRIVGIVLSAEYIFAARGAEPIPDDRRFGVFWAAERLVAPALDMDGAFNDAVLRLAPGAHAEQVIDDVDRALEPYGGLGAYGRDLHMSARMLDDEMRQQKVLATTIPAIFLFVAAFLINVVLGRLVGVQREQIAALKALGYGNGAIAWHYLKFAAVPVIAGSAGGIALGAWLGRLMTANYTQFFRLPELVFHVEPWLPLAAASISFASGAVGALVAARRAVSLAPAEAMRPPAPRRYRHGAGERALSGALSPRARMVMRVFTGRPWRSALATFGLALAIPVVILGLFWRDALDYMIDVQFRGVDRSHATITFGEPAPAAARREIAAMPGVTAAESFRASPVRLRAGHRSYPTAILGLKPDAGLRRMLDVELRPLAMPADGLALSQRLAARLGVGLGDALTVEVLEGRRPRGTLIVSSLVNDLIGLSAYMDERALQRFLGEGDTITGVAVASYRDPAPELYAALKHAPKVQTVTVTTAALRMFEETTSRFVLVFSGILTLFGAVIAVGVVYNHTRVALQERAWELASLRVLGFTRGEVAGILFGEIAVSLAVGIPLGLWLGYLSVAGITHLFGTEMFEIPPVIRPRTYLMAAGTVLAAAAASAWIVRRRIDRLDLVAVLKTRE
jgi:putative ABC transport system permease protein